MLALALALALALREPDKEENQLWQDVVQVPSGGCSSQGKPTG